MVLYDAYFETDMDVPVTLKNLFAEALRDALNQKILPNLTSDGGLKPIEMLKKCFSKNQNHGENGYTKLPKIIIGRRKRKINQ